MLEDENGRKYIKISVNGIDIPYSFDGRYYVRNVSADEKASNTVLRKMLTTSDSDILRQKSSPNQNLTFNTFFAILAGSGLHPRATKRVLWEFWTFKSRRKVKYECISSF